MLKTIMIVDDSASLRQALCITLQGAGYDTLQACDGQDALSKLRGQKVHLFISDVNMPHMDGICFTKAVKTLPAYRFTPIVMLTTESHAEKKAQARAAGANAWVLKPFNPLQLLSVVQQLVLP